MITSRKGFLSNSLWIKNGVITGLFSAGCFAGLNVLVKIGSPSLCPSEMMFARGLVGFILLTPFVYREIPSLFSKGTHFVWIRFIAGSLSVLSLFYNIQINGAGVATALANLTSIFVIFMSVFFLKESLLFAEWVGISLVILAAFTLHSPLGVDVNLWGGFLGLLGAVLGAIAVVSLKQIANKYSPLLIVWGFCFFCGLIACFSPGGPWVCDSLHHFILLLGAGCLGALGQIFLTISYRELSASTASAITLSAILWSVAMESVYFSQMPNLLSSISYLLMIIGLHAVHVVNARKNNQST